MFGIRTGRVNKLGSIGGGSSKRPTTLLDFSTDASFDSRVTFTRASQGTYFDKTGTMQVANTNIPRIDYGSVPSGVTNWLTNNTNVGVGVGTPGTAPTGYTFTSANGASSRQILGVGTINGVPYIDVRLFGVANTGGQLKFNAILMNAAPALVGTTWTGSAWVQLLADASTVPMSGMTLVLIQSGGANVYTVGPNITPASLATFQRQTFTATTTNVNETGIQLALWSNGASSINGDTIDITVRIGGAQLEQSASVNPLVLTSGAVTTVGATALGLMIEEARTNLYLNSDVLITQDVTVTAAPTSVSFYGTGTITFSGAFVGSLTGSGGAFPVRSSIVFTPTAGLLTSTVTGSVLKAQVETGAIPTSYIPTTGVTASRAADNATMPLTPILPFTVVGDALISVLSPSVAEGVAVLTDGTVSNRIAIRANTSVNNTFGGVYVVAGANTAVPQSVNTIAPGSVIKVGAVCKSTDMTLSGNGGATVNVVGAAPTGLNLLTLGQTSTPGNPLNGWLRRFRYWPRALSNAELQSVTT